MSDSDQGHTHTQYNKMSIQQDVNKRSLRQALNCTEFKKVVAETIKYTVAKQNSTIVTKT